MYFKDRIDTNIDDEFKKERKFNIKENKWLFRIIALVVVLIFVIIFFIFM